MKIGLVLDTTLDSDAGVQQYFKGLARFLLSLGHDIRFLVPPSKDKGEFKGKIISFGSNFSPIGNATSVPIAFFFGGGSRIKEVLEDEKFDVIHISAPFSPFLGAKFIKHAECPVVLTYHSAMKNWIYRLGAILLRIYLGGVYKRVDAHIAVSEVAKAEALLTIPGEYKIIPNGVRLSNFNPKVKPIEKFLDKKLNILFVGRLEERKGVYYLIKAFKKVKDDFKNVRLVIVGEGPARKKLENLVNELSLEDVVFEGYIYEDQKSRYYASADLCVFPAIYGESFGIVLIEAMSSGKIPISFANEGYKFVLRSLQDLLVEPKNVDELAGKILKFLKGPKLRQRYEKMCLKESKKYGWETVGNQILEIYMKLNKADRS